MALSFPSNPTVGQVYEQWTWDGQDGQKWVCSCVGLAPVPPPPPSGNGVIGMPSKTVTEYSF